MAPHFDVLVDHGTFLRHLLAVAHLLSPFRYSHRFLLHDVIHHRCNLPNDPHTFHESFSGKILASGFELQWQERVCLFKGVIWTWPNLGSGSYMKIYIYNIWMWQDNFPPRLSFLVHSNPTLPQLPQLGQGTQLHPGTFVAWRHLWFKSTPLMYPNP